MDNIGKEKKKYLTPSADERELYDGTASKEGAIE